MRAVWKRSTNDVSCVVFGLGLEKAVECEKMVV